MSAAQPLQFPGRAPWHLAQGYGHGERIFDVSFHPFNDNIVLTASEDTSVRMWKRDEGTTMYKQVRAYLGHAAEALRASWSANGLLVASGSADRTVRLWAADLEESGYTGRQLAVLDGHPEEVYHVEMLNPSVPPPRPSDPPRMPGLMPPRAGGGGSSNGGGGACSPDPLPPPLPPFETHILAASCESLFVWSLAEGTVMQQADAPGTSGSTITQADIQGGSTPAYIFSVARQPAGTLVAAACCDGVVRLWSMRPTGHLEWAGQIKLPGGPMITGCAFAADGARLGVVTRDGRVVELDVRTMELLTSRPLPASPLTVAYLPKTAAAASALGAGGGGGAQQQQQRELWLVACKDGGVYGYELDGQAPEPSMVLVRPNGAEAAQLAISVSRGGSAVAMAGEPQEASSLPAMRQPLPPSATAASPSASSHPAIGSSSSGAPTAVAQGGAAASTSASAAAAAPAPAKSAAAAGAAAAAPAAVVAPPRRRGAGSGPGRRVAGGIGMQDPLALFEEAGAGEEAAAAGGKAEQVTGGLAALSLSGGGGGGSVSAASRPGGGGGGAMAAAVEDEDEGMDEGDEVGGHHGGPAAEGGPAVRMRAPLMVYRSAW